MATNVVQISTIPDPEGVTTQKETHEPKIKEKSIIATILMTLNVIVNILTGVIVGVTLIFSLTINWGSTAHHIILCTIGYQLLMAQSILSLSPYNTWSLCLTLVDKRRIHWILQILGSVLVIAGSILMSLSKAINWNTLHGQFALVALVFTTVSLVNGLASLYAYEFRKFLPGIISKLTHICFGTVAFTTACVSLIYGYDKNSFRNWTSPELAHTMIALTVIFNAIIIISPLIAFTDKFVSSVKNKLG